MAANNKTTWQKIIEPFRPIFNITNSNNFDIKKLFDKIESLVQELEQERAEKNKERIEKEAALRENEQLVESLKRSVKTNQELINDKETCEKRYNNHIEAYARMFEIMLTHFDDKVGRKLMIKILKQLKYAHDESK